MLNKMLLFGGFVSLIHAAYSAAQRKWTLQDGTLHKAPY